MCFSAVASFTASAICAGIGAVAVSYRRSPITCIPLIFSAHQALEGVVWLTEGVGVGASAGYAFALIAYCLWPIYVPLAALSADFDPRLRPAMALFLALGVGIAAFNGYVAWLGFEISVSAGHVRYIASSDYPLILELAYAATTVVPFLLCRSLPLRIFGLLLLCFFVISTLFFNPARSSVWCFFAAASSVVLVAYSRQETAHHFRGSLTRA